MKVEDSQNVITPNGISIINSSMIQLNNSITGGITYTLSNLSGVGIQG